MANLLMLKLPVSRRAIKVGRESKTYCGGIASGNCKRIPNDDNLFFNISELKTKQSCLAFLFNVN
jgi:hypothetical protein